MGILIFETFVALVNLFFAEVLDSRSSSGSDRGGCRSAVLCASHHHHGPGSAKYYRCAHRSLADRAVGLRCRVQAGTRPESRVPLGAAQPESTCSWQPPWDAERKREITSSFVTRAPVPDPVRGSAARDAGRGPPREGSRRGRAPPGSRSSRLPGPRAAFQPPISAESELLAYLPSPSGQRRGGKDRGRVSADICPLRCPWRGAKRGKADEGRARGAVRVGQRGDDLSIWSHPKGQSEH